MTPRRLCIPKIAPTFAVFVICLAVSSCGHTEASAPAPSMDEVTQAIDNYGRGHQASVLPPPSPITQETDDQYTAKVKDAFIDSDFALLEKMAQENREKRGLVLGGAWKTNDFYGQVGGALNFAKATDEDYQSQIIILKNWLAAYPNSATPRIALARLYTAYAGFARGEESSDHVSRSQWRLYNERNVTAERYLLDAANLSDRDA
jgi:hypothetical protein